MGRELFGYGNGYGNGDIFGAVLGPVSFVSFVCLSTRSAGECCGPEGLVERSGVLVRVLVCAPGRVDLPGKLLVS
jgi:hypothetical protein